MSRFEEEYEYLRKRYYELEEERLNSKFTTAFEFREFAAAFEAIGFRAIVLSSELLTEVRSLQNELARKSSFMVLAKDADTPIGTVGTGPNGGGEGPTANLNDTTPFEVIGIGGKPITTSHRHATHYELVQLEKRLSERIDDMSEAIADLQIGLAQVREQLQHLAQGTIP